MSIEKALELLGQPYPRSFKEQMQDKIAYHQSQIESLQAVIDSMSPDVEKFVEALQKVDFQREYE